MSVLQQLVSTFLAGYLCFTLGLSYAWPSYTIPKFKTEITPLSRNVTTTDEALIGSIASIGVTVAVPMAGWLFNIIGRKWTLILTGIPYALTWLIIVFTTKVELIILAMFFIGVGGSGLMIIPLYIGEIAQPSIRGTMTSAVLVLYMLGILVSYLVGGWLTYKQIAYLMLGSSVINLALLCIFIRESPMYLLQIGKETEAKKVLVFYRKYSISSRDIEEEIAQTKKALNLEEKSDRPNDAEKQPLQEEKQVEVVKANQNGFFNSFKLLWTLPSSRRAFLTLLFIASCAISMGITCFIVYATQVFESLAPSYNITHCSVILALVQMCGGIVSTAITDLFGRKTLMMSSSYICALCSTVIGLQIQFRFGPEWVIVAALYMFTFAYNLGAGTVPSVLMAEIFPPEVKGLCSALILEWMALLNFVVLFAFTLIDKAVGMSGNFYMFGAMSVVCAVYTTFRLPETKGLSFKEIQMLFSETNKTGKK